MKTLALLCVCAAAMVAITPLNAQGPPGRGRGAARGPAGPLPRLADGHPDLTGIWTGIGFSGRAPEILPWAAKIIADRAAKQGAEDFEARCLPGGPPRMAPYHTALWATPKEVVILFEGNTHMYRQLFLDGKGHPKDLKPSFYGDSRALGRRWLVVDTIGFNEISQELRRHAAHEDMHLVEKFHRIDYGNLEEVTIDPGVFPKPWTQRKNIALDPAFDMTETSATRTTRTRHLDALLHSPSAAKTLRRGACRRHRASAAPRRPTPRMPDGKVSLKACGCRRPRSRRAIRRIRRGRRRCTKNGRRTSRRTIPSATVCRTAPCASIHFRTRFFSGPTPC
jgi:hypothetical protein